MITQKHIILGLVLATGLGWLGAPGAQATGSEGHGGYLFDCRPEMDQTSKIQAAMDGDPVAMLADLWEGDQPVPYGFSLQYEEIRDRSVAEIIDWAIDRLAEGNPDFAQLVRRTYHQIEASHHWVPEGIELEDPGDTARFVRPTGCLPRFIAWYRDDGLHVSLERLLTLSVMHQAAFWVHEAVYKVLRDLAREAFMEPVTDSKEAQRVTAHMFAAHFQFTPVRPTVDEGRLFHCAPSTWLESSLEYDQSPQRSRKWEFFVTSSPDLGVEKLYFKVFDGEPMVFLTVGQLWSTKTSISKTGHPRKQVFLNYQVVEDTSSITPRIRHATILANSQPSIATAYDNAMRFRPRRFWIDVWELLPSEEVHEKPRLEENVLTVTCEELTGQ